ncbi:TPA: LpxA family transferase [Candidatus Woesearchaeota archaeon]|nr:LpxA family transferase [Candidatus Woesearchaeota archaeon]
MDLKDYVKDFHRVFDAGYKTPWEITNKAKEIIIDLMKHLDNSFVIKDGVAIHKEAIIEKSTVIREPVIISKDCVVRSGSYLREGVYLANGVTIGPNCEVKSSFIFGRTRIAHLNYVGNSIIGSDVNLEAGAVIANHFNEKPDSEKNIKVLINGEVVNTNSSKFGSLIGDKSKIGANSVLSPGTILLPKTIVGRLELVDQLQ